MIANFLSQKTKDGYKYGITMAVACFIMGDNVLFITTDQKVVLCTPWFIIKTENAGEDWKIYQSKSHDGLYDLCFLNTLNGYIVGAKGKIMFTTDSGKTWVEDRLRTYVTLTGISKAPNGLLYVVGVNGTIIRIKPHK